MIYIYTTIHRQIPKKWGYSKTEITFCTRHYSVYYPTGLASWWLMESPRRHTAGFINNHRALRGLGNERVVRGWWGERENWREGRTPIWAGTFSQHNPHDIITFKCLLSLTRRGKSCGKQRHLHGQCTHTLSQTLTSVLRLHITGELYHTVVVFYTTTHTMLYVHTFTHSAISTHIHTQCYTYTHTHTQSWSPLRPLALGLCVKSHPRLWRALGGRREGINKKTNRCTRHSAASGRASLLLIDASDLQLYFVPILHREAEKWKLITLFLNSPPRALTCRLVHLYWLMWPPKERRKSEQIFEPLLKELLIKISPNIFKKCNCGIN